MVDAVSDEVAPAYTTIVVATKSRSRYWDGDGVRTEYADITIKNKGGGKIAEHGPKAGRGLERDLLTHAGAPLLDWWLVPAETVVERLIASMCPRRVCTTCGEPSRRIVEQSEKYAAIRAAQNVGTGRAPGEWDSNVGNRSSGFSGAQSRVDGFTAAEYVTLGWSDCGHNFWRPGVVYDPFQRNEKEMSTRFLVGDVFDGLATIPDDSVDLIVSSPPFLALRSYLPADHEDKALEIGSEATPGAFLDKLLDVVEECARVLAPHGSLVFELGDTYAGAGQSDEMGMRVTRQGRPRPKSQGVTMERTAHGVGWPLDKSKVLVPQLFAIALAYGFNPLTDRQTEPWRVRNTVAWCRPNPPVGRDGDKFRPATSFLTVATKARDRYWDGDAVRTEPREHSVKYHDADTRARHSNGGYAVPERGDGGRMTYGLNPAGAPLLDYWVIPTEPYSGSHYATFPRALVVPLVKSMCPQKVCRVCGEPSRRITAASYEPMTAGGRPRMTDAATVQDPTRTNAQPSAQVGNPSAQGMANGRAAMRTETLGWSDCGHDDWRPGMCLDPFCGSGTTLAVASGHGLDSIGIDLDSRNAELAAERVGGLFLEITEIRGAA